LEPATPVIQGAYRKIEASQMSGSRILVAVRVAASPEHAFEVFTKEIGSWWQPNVLFRFTPRSPGIVRFEGEAGGRLVRGLPAGKVVEVGQVRAAEPGS